VTPGTNGVNLAHARSGMVGTGESTMARRTVYGTPEEKQAKEELAALMRKVIKNQGLSQYAAARVIGVDQPKVSAIMSNRLVHFSSERLMRFLIMLGHDVQIVIKRKPKSRQGRLRVTPEI
jgi:predicted XRE-type DNA-binding protein